MPVPPTQTSGIRDNQSRRGTVADFLRQHLRPGAELDLVTAYFTVYAHDKLRAELDSLGPIRLLFGEAAFIKKLDAGNFDPAAFVLRDSGLALASGLRQGKLAEACAKWIKEKVDVRSVTKTGFLHGKMSHIRPHGQCHAIVGSSNFTTRGLGLADRNNNVELNLVVSDDRDRLDLQNWFEELWNDPERVEDVKQAVLDFLLRIYRDQSPEFIYFKTLYELFRRFIEEGRNIEQSLREIRLPETEIWRRLYGFQRDGAKSAINKIKTFGGCVLADSVGLGKTFEALAVIKYFELKNERVLVLCPKKLAENWLIFRQNSPLNPVEKDRFRYDVLHHTDLSRDKGWSNGIDLDALNRGNYDLVVIDESHNFRNNSPARELPDGTVSRPRYHRLVEEVIRAGIRSKVLLLSATPVNNDLADLRNQISLIAGGDAARDADADGAFYASLGIHSLKATTRDAQARFTHWAKLPHDQRDKKNLIHVLGGDFLKLLDALTIARSRRHVSKHYKQEMAKLGGFPVRRPPVSVHPEIDAGGTFPGYDNIAGRLSQYKLWLFQPAAHLRNDLPADIAAAYERRIGGFTQQGRERILTGMMRVSLLKRLESSIHSFRISLERTLEKIANVEKRMADFERFRRENPERDFDNLNWEDLTPEEQEDEELAEAFEIGKGLSFKMAHLDLDKWRTHLAEDRAHLSGLLAEALPVTTERDAKLAELKKRLADKITRPPLDKDGRPNRKVLVFTAYADTARYLYDNLKDWVRSETGAHASLVVGSGNNDSTFTRSRNFNDILLDFAPRSKRREERRGNGGDGTEVDVLIASDCISEGQNLQDCDTVINYDIHWNPVRIIQRFGRVDRIGSRATAVHLINFWPTARLDRYINLKLRVEARMALVDVTATQTDNPLDDEHLEELIEQDLRLRDRQLTRMQQEILDLEDFDDTVTLADFSLDDFRQDLIHYLRSHEDELKNAPDGLHAVVPPAADIPLAMPGILFCLRHKGDAPSGENEKVNPLAPHYLVYVRDGGEVRFAFTQAKTILSLFRELALGKTEPYRELCRLFDRQTQNGADMEAQTLLIQTAVTSITATYQQKLASGLRARRDFILPPAMERPEGDDASFELVTWLVIADPAG